MLLVARAINDFYFQIPIVAVTFAPGAGGKTVPTYEDAEIGQTVIDQITAAGGIPLSSSATADLLLAVSTPEDGLTREAGSPSQPPEDPSGSGGLCQQAGTSAGNRPASRPGEHRFFQRG